MSMMVRNNIEAVRILNLLERNNQALQTDLTQVSTGLKINSAQDDPAPYSISERMRVRIRALEQDNQNVQTDSALMKTAESAVSNTIEILKTLKERAINSANDSNTDEDRATIQKEVDQFIDQIDDNALIQFNGKYLIDGTKNNVVSSSKTILLNQSLATDTTSASALTQLANRAGDMLEILSTDKYQISWVMNGTTTTTSGTVGTGALSDLLITVPQGGAEQITTVFEQSTTQPTTIGTNKFNVELYTPERTSAIALVAATAGVTSQISGFTISIMDTDGNIKKAANAALDQFKQYQRAETQTGDKALTFHVGPDANVAIKVGMTDMRAEALGLKGDSSKLSVRTKEHANAAINVIENSLKKALDEQINIGAVLSRLEFTGMNILTARDNDQESESVIRDADMAKEITSYTKNNILSQTAQAMLAQANQNSGAILALFE